MNSQQDTIAAISTGTGSAGIGIIRISGDQAIETGAELFQSATGKDLRTAEAGKMLYGHIQDPETGKTVDEVLIVKMNGPHSYTAEDVVEINCHGGIVPTRRILDLVLSHGVRHAEPGEFTKRAFLNGRIDLTQAESVMDVISAKSDRALEISVGQLSGTLRDQIHAIDREILDMLVLIESNLDYPEYEIEELTSEKIEKGIESVRKHAGKILEYGRNSYLMREGVKTAIIGKPNVGKSSLLNLLLGEERAIVTDIPGTTRDVIHEGILIGDIPFVITDTAGIRETEDAVEKIGVEKSREAADAADLVLFMRDASQPLDQDEKKLMSELDPDKTIYIANKADLEHGDSDGDHKPADLNGDSDLNADLENVSRETIWRYVSVRNDDGIEDLRAEMSRKVTGGQVEGSGNSVLLNERQESLLRQMLHRIDEAEAALKSGMSAEFYSIDLTGAEESLREITGESLGEDVIDTIFERFCIGK
ncbi:MAG: tRNA uridine-5-carboxymethylaminomethyl(34) synthesis GTPase MnmE [Eubacteriaceae bacterium]|jgi:tRNA modification GTPase